MSGGTATSVAVITRNASAAAKKPIRGCYWCFVIGVGHKLSLCGINITLDAKPLVLQLAMLAMFNSINIFILQVAIFNNEYKNSNENLLLVAVHLRNFCTRAWWCSNATYCCLLHCMLRSPPFDRLVCIWIWRIFHWLLFRKLHCSNWSDYSNS